jgi:hypothetical protein
LGCQLSDKKLHFCFFKSLSNNKKVFFNQWTSFKNRHSYNVMPTSTRCLKIWLKQIKNKNFKWFLRNCHEICKETCHPKDIIKIFCIKSTRFTSSEYFQIQTNAKFW